MDRLLYLCSAKHGKKLPTKLKLMNRKTAFLSLALLCTASFVACGSDDDPQPNTEPVEVRPTPGFIKGWTSATHVPPEGGRAFFANFHSPNEVASVTVSQTADAQLTLTYASDAWGTATFTGLAVTRQGDFFILPAGATTTITMQRGAYGGNGGGEYALTLLGGSISTQLNDAANLVMSAFMSESHGSYELTFHQGAYTAPIED